jgi:FkbM family methyltransferase
MLCDTSDMIQRTMYAFGVWEPAVTAWFRGHIRHGDAVIDIGANVGYYSLLAAELVGDTGEVLSVEASPAIFDLLRDNLLRNPRLNPRVRAVNVAAAEQPGTLRFFDALGGNLGTSSTVAPTDKHGTGVEVQAVSVSALIADPGRVKLIKIDVEGDELACLRGLRPTLHEMLPGASVLVEVTPRSLAERGEKPDDVYGLLRDCGFEPRWTLPNDYDPIGYAFRRDWSPTRWTVTTPERSDIAFIKG